MKNIYYKIFASLGFLFFVFGFASVFSSQIYAQTPQCNPKYPATVIAGCRKIDTSWDIYGKPTGGYCAQDLATWEVDCSKDCTATYFINGCSTWATGCVWQPQTHQNTHACGPGGGTGKITSTPGGGGGVYTPTLTPTPVAYCQNILAYNSNWTLLTNTQLTQTKAGDSLYYCVTGYAANAGTFDRARFTINSNLLPDTTLLRPGTTGDYCQAYTVPSGVYDFSILGEVHNTVLGWVN